VAPANRWLHSASVYSCCFICRPAFTCILVDQIGCILPFSWPGVVSLAWYVCLMQAATFRAAAPLKTAPRRLVPVTHSREKHLCDYVSLCQQLLVTARCSNAGAHAAQGAFPAAARAVCCGLLRREQHWYCGEASPHKPAAGPNCVGMCAWSQISLCQWVPLSLCCSWLGAGRRTQAVAASHSFGGRVHVLSCVCACAAQAVYLKRHSNMQPWCNSDVRVHCGWGAG
jgi:hypothetical protein